MDSHLKRQRQPAYKIQSEEFTVHSRQFEHTRDLSFVQFKECSDYQIGNILGSKFRGPWKLSKQREV